MREPDDPGDARLDLENEIALVRKAIAAIDPCDPKDIRASLRRLRVVC
jgi:hypothetical protein